MIAGVINFQEVRLSWHAFGISRSIYIMYGCGVSLLFTNFISMGKNTSPSLQSPVTTRTVTVKYYLLALSLLYMYAKAAPPKNAPVA